MLATISCGALVTRRTYRYWSCAAWECGHSFRGAHCRWGLDAHQSGIERRLGCNRRNTPSSINTLRWVGMAFVVHIERTPSIGHGAVIQHRDALGGHALADACRCKRARALAVEVALQAVANGFVQQHPRPAWTQAPRSSRRQGRHALPNWSRASVHRFLHVRRQSRPRQNKPNRKRPPPPAEPVSRRPFCSAITRHRQADQRAHIGGHGAIGTRHQDHIVLGRPNRPSPAPRAGRGHLAKLFGVLEQGHFLAALSKLPIGSCPRGTRLRLKTPPVWPATLARALPTLR